MENRFEPSFWGTVKLYQASVGRTINYLYKKIRRREGFTVSQQRDPESSERFEPLTSTILIDFNENLTFNLLVQWIWVMNECTEKKVA